MRHRGLLRRGTAVLLAFSLSLGLCAQSFAITGPETELEALIVDVNPYNVEKLITDVEKQMRKAAADLNFEAAAQLRDKMIDLKKVLQDMD